MTLAGRATPEGTRRYRDRLIAAGVAPSHFRRVQGLWMSSIGLGTYLGDADDVLDERYREAAVEAARLGCNVFDTAANYRHQRSERALGEAFRRMDAEGIARRDELVVATKGGYIPFDGEAPADPRAYFLERFLEPGVFGPGDVVGGMHCMTPRYLQDQIRRSLENLGLDAVDIYYVHNPETQLDEVKRDDFRRRMRAACEMLEVKGSEEQISFYGVATWNGFRVPPDAADHLDLPDLARVAREVGADAHGFRFVQLPHNLAMPEALVAPTQPAQGTNRASLLEAASRAGISVVASASLHQGHLGSGLPPEIGEAFPDLESDAQRAIQFVRSTPGMSVALVGMSRREHVEENLGLARRPPATVEQFKRLFRPA
jgi:aryl-alcohol dehydrogenase-like predicted oxidoreductase